MPFFILRDFTGRISDQLDFEEKGRDLLLYSAKIKETGNKKYIK